MQSRMRSRGRRKLKAEINVVPYIDVMLVLLIIFMVTAPLMNLGVEQWDVRSLRGCTTSGFANNRSMTFQMQDGRKDTLRISPWNKKIYGTAAFLEQVPGLINSGHLQQLAMAGGPPPPAPSAAQRRAPVHRRFTLQARKQREGIVDDGAGAGAAGVGGRMRRAGDGEQAQVASQQDLDVAVEDVDAADAGPQPDDDAAAPRVVDKTRTQAGERGPPDPVHLRVTAELLARLAAEAGLDAAEAAAVLASGRYATEVRDAESQWQQAGIRSVPSIVINRQHLVQGGQPPEVFEQALRQIAAGSASARKS